MPGNYTGTVDEIIQETPTVRTVKFRTDKPVHFKPGQYMLYTAESKGQKESTPYSIFSPVTSDHVAACVKRVEGGFFSNHMHSLEKGDTVPMSGPMGQFTLREPIERDAVFVATGTGISPLHSMIHRVFELGTERSVYLFFGCRTQNEIIRRAEYEQLAEKHENFTFVPTLSREQWDGRTGYVQEHIPDFVSDPGTADLYLAGVKGMVEQVSELLEKMGFAGERIHTEKFV